MPPTRRPTVHHRVNPCLGAHRQNETETFSDHDETSPSIAVSALSVLVPVACSMLAVEFNKAVISVSSAGVV